MRIRILFFFFIVCFFACQQVHETQSRVTQLPYYADASFTPHWMTKSEADFEDFHKVSSFELINQEGEIISEETFKDKIYVTDFFFTSCPGICPKMMDNIMHFAQIFLVVL